MSCTLLGRSVSVFALIGAGWAGAEVSGWEELYVAGMRALNEGRYPEAREKMQAAYDRARKPPADEPARARTAYGLGAVLRALGDCGSAEQLQREARAILEARGDSSVLLAMVWKCLGETLMEQEKYDDAGLAFQAALRVPAQEPAMRQCVFLCRRHLAEIQFLRQDIAGAEELLKGVIADARQAPESADLAGALGSLARVYMVEHRFAEAEKLLREAVDRDLPRGEQSLALADSRVTLATLYRVEGRLERAEPLFRRALKTYETSRDPHASMVYLQLGWCALAEHKYMVAREFMQKAVDIAAQAPMPDPIVSKLRDELASVGAVFARSTKSRH